MAIVVLRFDVDPAPGQIDGWTETLGDRDASVMRLPEGNVEFTAWFDDENLPADLTSAATELADEFITAEPSETLVMTDDEFEEYAENLPEPDFVAPPIIDKFWG